MGRDFFIAWNRFTPTTTARSPSRRTWRSCWAYTQNEPGGEEEQEIDTDEGEQHQPMEMERPHLTSFNHVCARAYEVGFGINEWIGDAWEEPMVVSA